MTIGELVKKLSIYPDNMPIIMAKDSEGNSFSPLSDFDWGNYEPINTWSGEYSGIESNESVKAICMWPTN